MKIAKTLLIVTALSPVSAFAGVCDFWNSDKFWTSASSETVEACLEVQHGQTGVVGEWTTPIQLAASFATDATAISALIESGANVSLTDEYGVTPLHIAAGFNANAIIVDALLMAGATHTAQDIDGQTPLHTAASGNDISVITALIIAGADINALDKNNRTPLHIAAVLFSDPTLLDTLIAAGANRDIKDRFGFVPFDYIKNVASLQSTSTYQLMKPASQAGKN